MGYQLPNGSKVQLGQTLGDAISISGATNAAECVLTFSGTAPAKAPVKGDVVIFTACPWTLALNAAHIVKAYDATAKTITLLKFDTSSTNDYPAGAFSVASPGEIRVVTGFIDFPYITDVNVGGGDQQTTSFQPLQVDRAITLNTFKNGMTQAFTFTHDSTDPIRPVLEALDKSQAFTAIKFINPQAAATQGGETRLYSAKVSFNEIPNTQVNNVETVVATLALQSKMRFYTGNDLK